MLFPTAHSLTDANSQSGLGSLLIVEDDITLNDQLTALLSNQGYRVTGCTCGQKALDELKLNHFDLILLDVDVPNVSNRSSGSIEELSKIAPTVLFMVDPQDYWNTTQQSWKMIGQIFEQEERVERTIAQQQAQINDIRLKTKVSAPKALTVMSNGGNLSTFGEQSRYSAIYRLFGFKEASSNIKTSTHGDIISFEYIASANPDYLLILDRDQAIGRAQGKALAQFDNALIHNTNAAQNKNIAHLNSEAWYISASGITANQIMIDDINSVLD